jgi:hypothetical protein
MDAGHPHSQGVPLFVFAPNADENNGLALRQ